MSAASRRGAWAGILCALFQAACGGETSGGSTCSDVTACGGDLTGVWHMKSTCIHLDASSFGSGDAGTGLPDACSSLLTDTVNTAQVTPIDATLEFTADGRYIQSGSMRVSETTTYSAACLSALGVADVNAFCSGAEQQIKNSSSSSSSSVTFDSVSCTVAGGGCTCSLSGTATSNRTGTYTTDGDHFYLDGRATGAPYCVTGGSLAYGAAGSQATGSVQLEK